MAVDGQYYIIAGKDIHLGHATIIFFDYMSFKHYWLHINFDVSWAIGDKISRQEIDHMIPGTFDPEQYQFIYPGFTKIPQVNPNAEMEIVKYMVKKLGIKI